MAAIEIEQAFGIGSQWRQAGYAIRGFAGYGVAFFIDARTTYSEALRYAFPTGGFWHGAGDDAA